MFESRCDVRGQLFGVISLASDDRCLFAAAECDGRDTYSPGVVTTLLREAMAPLQTRDDEDVPRALAASLAEVVARTGDGRDRPSWLFFAAALARRDVVSVCTAGDLRIQLVRDGRVIETTRDHILRDDADEELLRAMPPEHAQLHGNMSTRSIGSSRRPPEALLWHPGGDYTLLISSSHHHRHEAQVPAWPDAGRDEAGLIVELSLHR